MQKDEVGMRACALPPVLKKVLFRVLYYGPLVSEAPIKSTPKILKTLRP